jgi:hypothetical protein
MNISETTRILNQTLGPTLVAALAGSRNPHASREWASQRGDSPTEEQAIRLRVAYKAWSAIEIEHGSDIARAWFIGANPWLGEDTPIDATREGRFAEMAASAQAMIDDAFSG